MIWDWQSASSKLFSPYFWEEVYACHFSRLDAASEPAIIETDGFVLLCYFFQTVPFRFCVLTFMNDIDRPIEGRSFCVMNVFMEENINLVPLNRLWLMTTEKNTHGYLCRLVSF